MNTSGPSLAGKVAIVTGSGRETGIGAGIAYALASEGASITIHFVSDSTAARAAKVKAEVEKLGGAAAIVRADTTVADGPEKIVQETLRAFNTDKIDILVNNAGGTLHEASSSLSEMKPEHILDNFKLNYLSPIMMVQSVLPHMPSDGRIINIGAMASQMYLPFQPAYGASKAALDHSTRYLAAELGQSRGITVNTVAPGGVLTDPLMSAPAEVVESVTEMSASRSYAARRMGTVDDIADIVLFVASEKCRWITGHVFPAGGGMF